jgi:hypothetical protein
LNSTLKTEDYRVAIKKGNLDGDYAGAVDPLSFREYFDTVARFWYPGNTVAPILLAERSSEASQVLRLEWPSFYLRPPLSVQAAKKFVA